MARPPRFAVYSSSLGNQFFDEIAELLACGLRELGCRARRADESRGFLAGVDWHLVVAPHEFFVQGTGGALRRRPLPPNLVFYGAEQAASPWFSLALQLYPKAREVWHLDAQAAGALAGRGLPARHVPLGYAPACPLFDPVRELPRTQATAHLSAGQRRRPAGWSDRPIDVLFAGSLTARRGLFFTRNASALSRRRCFLHLVDARFPLRPDRPGALDGRALAGLEQRAKVVLNIHREQSRFLEWHRLALHGLAQGALVVTEPVGPAAPLQAGRDFVEAAFEDIPAALDHYLGSARGRRRAEAIAAQGRRTFLERCRMADFLRPALDGLLRGASPAAPALPAAAPARPPVKPEVLRVSRGAPAPRVTVAVSLYNYRRYLAECLDSVAAQTLRPLELVIVDDASTDGSAEAALRWLRRRGRRFARWTLVRQRANRGLAAARNEAFSRARARYVFVLDADNTLLPHCLERLAQALDSSGAAFAFPLLHRFGEEELLMNLKAWDPRTLRARPYIDAMALVRKAAWKAAGGFRSQAVQGWEDYDFWLRLARRGDWGAQVPEILGRYRVHMRSMLHAETEPDLERLKRQFLAEHGVALDADNVAQAPAALSLYGDRELPVRVESPDGAAGGARKGHYLVTALSILKDLNRDLLGPAAKS